MRANVEFLSLPPSMIRPGDLVAVLMNCGRRRMNRWKRIDAVKTLSEKTILTTKAGDRLVYQPDNIVEIRRAVKEPTS